MREQLVALANPDTRKYVYLIMQSAAAGKECTHISYIYKYVSLREMGVFKGGPRRLWRSNKYEAFLVFCFDVFKFHFGHSQCNLPTGDCLGKCGVSPCWL